MNRVAYVSRYRFAANVLWRREKDGLFLLDPARRRMLKLRSDLASYVDADGSLSAEGAIRPAVEELAKVGIFEPSISGANSIGRRVNTGPFNATVQITEACNLRCGHCHNDREGPSKMTLAQFERLARELREMSVFSVNISGGEPTVHPEIVQIIKCVDSLGMQTTMSTNATNLNEDLVSRLAHSGLRRVQVSLDAASAELHDAARGVRGSFERMSQGVAILRRHEIEYMFVTTLTSQSVKEYEDTIDLAFNWGASAHKTNTVVPQGRAKGMNLLTGAALLPYIDVWQRKKQSSSNRFQVLAETMFQVQMQNVRPQSIHSSFECGCPAGVLTCGIKPNGDVIPCSFFSDVVLGNALERGFESVWTQTAFGRRPLHQIAKKEPPVSSSMFGCRARAYAVSGDLITPDPYCFARNPQWEGSSEFPVSLTRLDGHEIEQGVLQ